MMQETIKSIDIFKSANDDEIRTIAHNSSIKEFRNNEVILSVGEDSAAVYYVISGQLQVFLENDEGKLIVLNELNKSDCFGDLGVICNSKRCANIICNSDVTLLIINGHAYINYCLNNLTAAKQTINKLANSLRKLTQDYQSLALNKLEQRLMRVLIEVSNNDSNCLVVTKTHSQLAYRVSATRESISRVISNFQKQGLVSYSENKLILSSKLLEIYSHI